MQLSTHPHKNIRLLIYLCRKYFERARRPWSAPVVAKNLYTKQWTYFNVRSTECKTHHQIGYMIHWSLFIITLFETMVCAICFTMFLHINAVNHARNMKYSSCSVPEVFVQIVTLHLGPTYELQVVIPLISSEGLIAGRMSNGSQVHYVTTLNVSVTYLKMGEIRIDKMNGHIWNVDERTNVLRVFPVIWNFLLPHILIYQLIIKRVYGYNMEGGSSCTPPQLVGLFFCVRCVVV